MNYKLELIRDSVRNFAEQEIRPYTREIDEGRFYPDKLLKMMADQQLMGVTIPREYGGAGLGFQELSVVLEEIARVCASSTMHITSSNTLVGQVFLEFATEEQKKQYLVPLAKGEVTATFALSEPEAGSDALAMSTKAEEDGDNYILNGRKTFITNALESEFIVVFAVTNSTNIARGTTAFIVDRNTEGMIIGKPENKMGMNGSNTSDVLLRNVVINKNQVLGRIGSGFKMAMKSLDMGRIGVAAQAVGIGQSAVDEAVQFTKKRVQFGRSISSMQGVRFMLADMQTRLSVARAMVEKVARKIDEKEKIGAEASIAKYYATETCVKIAGDALQLHGGYGYTKDYAIERIFRDSRVTTIYEGTSQIQQILIARDLLD
ncbi:MAG: acyl-CoA dehydrogenase family protein [Tissierellia bacterium]|nr:acyl-CoA dehydrogenase family protein [Tissierellia bacterium]